MHRDVIERTADLADRIQEAHRTGPLERLADEFAEVLQTFPDYPAMAFPSGFMDVVNAEAERVIGKIESWINKELADGEDAQRLAEAVYRIRRALEEIDHWRRHYLLA